MPNLKELKNRQVSVKATQKITRAMQMVAAAKLNKAQESAQSARPYASKISAVMANLLTSIDGSSNAPELMVGNGKSDTHLLVVATADRGLCGAFNSNIVKLFTQEINELMTQSKQVKIICIGKKGHDLIRRSHEDKIIDFILELADVKEKVVNVEDLYKEDNVDLKKELKKEISNKSKPKVSKKK